MQRNLFITGIILIFFITACASSEDSSNIETQVDDQPLEQSEDPHIKNKKDESNPEPSYTININDDDSISALVNKQNSLSESYQPKDLIPIEVPKVLENPEVNQLRQEAAHALKDMFDEALNVGLELYARSGFRSYETQEQLFSSYAEKHGTEAANRYSAKPGHSEHQTGLVMDITSESANFQLEKSFGDTDEGKWVRDNAHNFGFIIRYPENKEDITGYIYEPWHLRYLGKELATEIYQRDITYEEFLVEEGIIDEVDSNKSAK